jgi:hypothetical protein
MEPRDYACLWAWEPLEPADLARVLFGLRTPWWICGGWALDLFLGRNTRRHVDLDVALLRRDQHVLFRHLGGWDLRYATPHHNSNCGTESISSRRSTGFGHAGPAGPLIPGRASFSSTNTQT